MTATAPNCIVFARFHRSEYIWKPYSLISYFFLYTMPVVSNMIHNKKTHMLTQQLTNKPQKWSKQHITILFVNHPMLLPESTLYVEYYAKIEPGYIRHCVFCKLQKRWVQWRPWCRPTSKWRKRWRFGKEKYVQITIHKKLLSFTSQTQPL